ncbi:hypothetical protein Rsub_08052 [Raphidocelis subcapitata]|uniref:Uncharacterized protein n=1 Tax=Raphidocelis subcapitata TaxID=307507 RepID=A0A2V0P8P0_9CHLO|nr:hypothetical protein Rsub_08052 [Raphidocelis subcapitata]|eukprot:GBF95929.1 hypothetical protein Rsub_08052 [Raphidocelis subcapitata]
MTLSARLDRWFDVTKRGSTVETEIKAGVCTFLTMSYILLVNPQILGAAGEDWGSTAWRRFGEQRQQQQQQQPQQPQQRSSKQQRRRRRWTQHAAAAVVACASPPNP